MEAYLEIVRRILREGKYKDNRTGVGAYTIAGATFEHDMSEGFPLLTTKKMATKSVRSELEFFIQGLTDKRWLQEQGNTIWDEWCNPQKVPYGHDPETLQRMREERDLGPIYGFQWRHFGAEYHGHDADYTGQGIDQLAQVVEKLKTNPQDRRMVVSSWNPLQIAQMALPPCHYSFQVTVIDDKVNLLWNQRSVDTMLGLPFNVASYGFLLHLLARESGLGEGKLVGFLGDVHIYKNHREGAEEQLARCPNPLPRVETSHFTSVFEWKHDDTKVIDYQHHPPIKFSIAI